MIANYNEYWLDIANRFYFKLKLAIANQRRVKKGQYGMTKKMWDLYAPIYGRAMRSDKPEKYILRMKGVR
jgi:hypothetical protein